MWSAHGRPHLDTLTVLRSLSKSLRANVTLSLPRLSIRSFMPAPPRKSGNAALGKFGLVGHVRRFRTLWTLNHSSCLGALGPLPPVLVCSPGPSPPFFQDCVSSEACACVCSQPFHALGLGPWSCPVRSPSAVWPHCCSPWPPWKPLLGMMPRLSWRRLRLQRCQPRLAHLRPRSRSHTPLPKAAPSRPRGCILLNQRGSTGLSVKSSPVPRLIARFPLVATPAASATGPVESQSTAGVARSPAPREPHRVRWLGRQVRGVLPQAPLKHSNAGGTSTAAGCDAPPNDRCFARE